MTILRRRQENFGDFELKSSRFPFRNEANQAPNSQKFLAAEAQNPPFREIWDISGSELENKGKYTGKGGYTGSN